MNFLGVLLLPIWALADARPESTFSTISRSTLVVNKEPIFLLSTKMKAQSPETTEVPMLKVVHNQDINKRILIALIISSTLLVGILTFLSCFWINRMKSSKNCRAKNKQNLDHAANGQSLSPISSKIAGKRGSVAVVEYQILEAATNNFQENNILGEGGRGRVYRAHLNEKLVAAVKRLEGDGQDIEREFENELRLLVKLQHQNIIFLMGCCIHRGTRFLVYEMMQNGSLESQLHGPTHETKLTWHLRMKIAVDIARGLEYLHEHCNPPIIHRDLKSSNILLDSNFNAKLSDFGLATPAGIHKDNIELSGTLGYVAPEYLLDGKLTDKSDVYAFGVVLLELLTGRKPVERVSQESVSIVSWVIILKPCYYGHVLK
uniref:Protein kinase domain-containing protein n=1 Tax=Rhizophora mucronata TaxID=61149 RepID=A0A2P2JQ41_RHIMU